MPPPPCDSLAPPAAKRVKVESAQIQPVVDVTIATRCTATPCDGGATYSIGAVVADGHSQDALGTRGQWLGEDLRSL